MTENIVKFLQLNRGTWVVQNNIYNLSLCGSSKSNYQTHNTTYRLGRNDSIHGSDIFTISNQQHADYFVIPTQQFNSYCSGMIIRHPKNCQQFSMKGSFLISENLSMITYFDNGQFQIYEKIWFEHINLRLQIQVIKEFGHSIYISFRSDIRK